jgi:glycosyltransferase involved in cell wall biosynthesis
MAAHDPAAPVDQLTLPAAGAPAAAAPQPDPHQALQPLLEAAARTRAKVAVLRVPMAWQGPPWLPRLIKGLIKQVLFLGPHVRLAAQLWRRRDHDLIVVREFLTALLIIVWPLIWPLRGRVHFLINHNLQEAHRRGLERRVLRLLHRTGCRFACFETTAGFTELGIIPDALRFLVIPHPLPGGVVARPAPAAGTEPTVGVIGEVRAEKGSAGLLETLLDLRRQGSLRARLLLGCPEAELLAHWQGRGFEAVDTTRREDYLAALDRCDVVILNYRRERYQYRPSGVAADAMARGAAVVCPDFPLMRQQLSVPAPVGAVFESLADLPAAIARALALRATLPAALAAHQQARDATALARLLDAFVAARDRLQTSAKSRV